MSFYEPGMPQDLHRANAEYESITRRVRNPGALANYLGIALKYAQEYFRAKKTASETGVKLLQHLGRCEECRTYGWEKCEQMKAHLTSGTEFTTTSI